MAERAVTHAVVGDDVLIRSPGHSPGAADRSGEIVALLGKPGERLYLVRWLDGRESVLAGGVAKVVRGRARLDLDAALLLAERSTT